MTAAQAGLLDWCALLRDAWQQAPEDADIPRILLAASDGEVHPSRPVWAEQVVIDAIFYPEVIVRFKAERTVGDVRVEASQTSLVYLDTFEDADETFIGGDIETEQIRIGIEPDELTVDTAHDLITAAGRLLHHIATEGDGIPPVVFSARDELSAGRTMDHA